MEKKSKIKLLCLQIGSIIGNKFKNEQKVEAMLEEALTSQEVDFVFLPEVWNVGWDCPSFINVAENFEKSSSIALLKDFAKKYSVNIIGGSLIEKKSNGDLVNSCPVIDRKGELICTYEKNHLFSYYGCDEGNYVKAGKTPVMVELDGLKIGLSICYDIRFPEIYREYRKAGADLLVNMAAWGSEKSIAWKSMTTARAVENQTYFVALTQTGYLRDGSRNLGRSSIISYKGDVLSSLGEEEGYFFVEIDLEEMYEFREKCTILNDIKDSYEVKKV